MLSKVKILLAAAFGTVILFSSGPLTAQSINEIRYVTLPGSKMWIDGTSNIDSFTCKTQNISGMAEILKIKDAGGKSIQQNTDEKDSVKVLVAVKSLDCGNSLMNDDMFNAMKYKKYPMIKYILLNAHLESMQDTAGGWFILDTKGYLFIAGEKNEVDIPMKVRKLSDGSFRLIGSKALSMKDYGIIPPTHFFGLIRAHEGLVVHFDLLAAREPDCKIPAKEGYTRK